MNHNIDLPDEVVRLKAKLDSVVRSRDNLRKGLMIEMERQESIQAQCNAAVAGLESVEWVDIQGPVRWHSICPSCWRDWPEHSDDCKLDAALKLARGE